MDAKARDLLNDAQALGRLTSLTVHDVMRSPAVVFRGAEHLSLREAAGRRRFIYVIERDGTLIGWLDTHELQDGQTAQDLVTHVDPGTVCITPENTLREALVRMLECGFGSMSVTDDAHHLVGEVTVAAIVDAARDDNVAVI